MKNLNLLLGLLVVAGGAVAQTQGLIAGLTPDRRPEGAPVITQFEQTPAWWEAALHGISPPQNGVGFLKYQGAWYTPFILPNSTGRYDIRGFHAVKGRKE
ncbi:MAG: hypothetical protein KA535_04345 [Azonexus sp.]|nr:hypothetical protein [Azonexus sp.]